MSKVEKYESFFTDETYTAVKNYIDNLIKNKSNSFTTSLSWEYGLKKSSALIGRYDFEKDDLPMFSKIKKEIESKIPFYVKSGVFHIFPNLSYIAWHSDPHCKAALTIYLNENWDEDWGGYLMYEENNEIKAVKPEKNLGVLQETPVNHSVSCINIGADYRISLQFFLTDKKKLM